MSKTVREVASVLGCSVQAVYNRLEKDFKPYLKTENGKKVLDDAVLQYINSTDNSSDFKESFKEVLKLLEKQNEQLQAELTIKNNQIQELNARLEEAHRMVDYAQQLHGADKALELKEAHDNTVKEGKLTRWILFKQFISRKQ